jgi:uncharacterized protein
MTKLSIYTVLFTEQNKFYLYNSRSNFFSEISADLHEALKNESFYELPKEISDELMQQEVLVDDKDKYDFYYSELLKFSQRNNNRETLNLVIAPTTNCNFACPYCFESREKTHTITDSKIKDIAEFVKNFYGSKKISITWYGGEPLIAFSKMKKIYSSLTKDGFPEIIAQHIITNGYCINKEIIKFFKTYGCKSIQITIDGLKDRHNRTRRLKDDTVPTFDKILNNIDLIVSELNSTILNIRVNIDKRNYTDFIEVYNFFKHRYQSNKNIHVYPGILREETTDNQTLCETSFRSSELLDLHKLIRDAGIDVSDFPKRRNKGCMMQQISSFLIGPDGNLYKCWNDLTNPSAAIGNLKDDKLTNSSLYIKYMMQSSVFNEECRECYVFPICDGGCSQHRYRNKFEMCNFDTCSPYKDLDNLKQALLNGTLK